MSESWVYQLHRAAQSHVSHRDASKKQLYQQHIAQGTPADTQQGIALPHMKPHHHSAADQLRDPDVYAKNWAAYAGDNYGQILNKDRAWTVSDRQMAVTNNAYFMHCLPVRRNMIVTDEVIESPQ